MNALAVEPAVVDLRQHSAFFFELGVRIGNMFDTGGGGASGGAAGSMARFLAALRQAAVRRYLAIMEATTMAHARYRMCIGPGIWVPRLDTTRYGRGRKLSKPFEKVPFFTAKV